MSIFSASLFIEKCVSAVRKDRLRNLFGVGKRIFLLAIFGLLLVGFAKQAWALPAFSAPTLSYVSSTATTVTLNWDMPYPDSTDIIYLYRNNTYVTSVFYGPQTVTNVPCGEQSFFLIAISYSGQQPQSNTVYATAANCPAMTGPTLSGSSGGSTGINLSWNDPNTNEEGYRVYKNSLLLTTLGANSTAYSDSGMTCGTSNSYYVQAYNSASGQSAYSNTVTASTDACPVNNPPNAPSGFTGIASGLNSIYFTWTDNSTDETSFILSNDTDLVSYTLGVNTTSDTRVLTCGRNYSFSLKAIKNALSSSTVSVSVSTRSCDVTPPTCTLSPASGTNYSTYNYNVGVSCSDTSGIAAIYTCTGNNINCGPGGGSGINPATVSITYPITKLCYYATDTIGNASSSTCATYYLRPTSPNSIDLTCSYNGPATIGWWDTADSESSFTINRTGPVASNFTAPAKSGSGWTSYVDNSCPISGDYTYAVKACNSAGCSNEISGVCQKSNCDVTPPTGSIGFTGGVATTNQSSIGMTSYCTDSGSGCASWIIYGTNGCNGSAIASGTGTSGTATVSLGVAGVNTIYAKVTDNVGLSTCVSKDIFYDTTAPSGSVSINSGAATTTSTSVTLNLSCSDNTDGPGSIAYRSTKKYLSFMDKVLSWFGFNKTVQAVGQPGADGAIGCRRYDVYNSASCPAEASTIAGASPTGGASSNVSYTLPAGDGTKNVAVKYTDGAGNTSCATSSIVLDTIAPTCTMSLSGTTLTANCSDATSGCAAPTSKTQTVTTSGTYTFNFTDNAGNTGNPSCSYAYTVIQPPTACTSVSVSNANVGAVSGYTKVSPARFQCYGSSGGVSSEYRRTVYYNGVYQYQNISNSYIDVSNSYGNGSYIVYIEPHNAAGYGPATSGAIYIDTDAPSINATPQTKSDNRASFTVSVTDSLSGVVSITPNCSLYDVNAGSYVINSSTQLGGKPYNCSCSTSGCSVGFTKTQNNNGDYRITDVSLTDAAGNVLSGTFPTLTVDNKAPTISAQ